MKSINKGDPFWSKNSKLTVEEIENKFPGKIATTLKVQKAAEEKQK